MKRVHQHPEAVVVCEFDLDVDIGIPAHLKHKIWREVNIFNIGGNGTVPLDKEWPQGKHGPMQGVHWNLAAGHRRKLRIQVMSDGNLVIKR